jgi:NAD(P)-dependent dehydrogenase (short-subunit alcohol dehydrogenase family)
MNPPVAMVAGAGPGLGRALAQRFSQGGMRVALLARDAARLNALAASIGPDARPLACDLTDPDAVSAAFDRVDRELGAPECIVFNAGTYRPGAVLEVTPQDFLDCWKVGCYAGFLVGQQAARRMVERGRGSILFTGATASLRGGARFVNLASPKFALRALAQSMARELGPAGIHVAHIIIDGAIDTAFIRDNFPERYALKAQDGILAPDAIAENYWQLHCQTRSAWTHELDLRPWLEAW